MVAWHMGSCMRMEQVNVVLVVTDAYVSFTMHPDVIHMMQLGPKCSLGHHIVPATRDWSLPPFLQVEILARCEPASARGAC
jgi:hypothetical protein